MEFNANKCHVIILGKSMRRLAWGYKLGDNYLQVLDKEENFGGNFSSTLSLQKII